MSYDISLVDPVTRETLSLDAPHHMRGGTYPVGGSTEASLNVTYNYGMHLRAAFNSDKGIRTIYGMSGAESLPILERAISELDDDVDPDYWKSTQGNTKRALTQLLALAKMRPDGVWDGD